MYMLYMFKQQVPNDQMLESLCFKYEDSQETSTPESASEDKDTLALVQELMAESDLSLKLCETWRSLDTGLGAETAGSLLSSTRSSRAVVPIPMVAGCCCWKPC